jgi:hypothetical protein
MANAEIWRARAMAWKESGKRSSDYCRDHGLDAGQLRSWTSKLGLSKRRKSVRVETAQSLPRLARVVPRPTDEGLAAVIACKPAAKSGVAIRVGKIGIHIGVGYDDGTLRSVLRIAHEVCR